MPAPDPTSTQSAPTIQLADIVGALEEASFATHYLHRRTGQLVAVPAGDLEIDMEDLDFPVASLEEFESDDWLPLPGTFEINEWETMKDFSESLPEVEHRQHLLAAIHRKGAFRNFKDRAGDLGLLEGWYTYLAGTLEKMARNWLEAHELPYE